MRVLLGGRPAGLAEPRDAAPESPWIAHEPGGERVGVLDVDEDPVHAVVDEIRAPARPSS